MLPMYRDALAARELARKTTDQGVRRLTPPNPLLCFPCGREVRPKETEIAMSNRSKIDSLATALAATGAKDPRALLIALVGLAGVEAERTDAGIVISAGRKAGIPLAALRALYWNPIDAYDFAHRLSRALDEGRSLVEKP